jgi:peptidyl-prolyl cis-trans isomerase A (cyclophilin A)
MVPAPVPERGGPRAGSPAFRAVVPLLAAALLLAGCLPFAVAEPPAAAGPPPLMDPASAALNQPAPETFAVRFETTQGDFVVAVDRALAPRGADRFYNLARHGYYDGVRFFRVLPGFVVQFGIHGEPALAAVWREARIPDDPVRASNLRGTLTYAMAGPDTRTVQLFLNLADNTRLDAQGFAPFGRVVEGMDVVDRLHAGYGEGAPMGRGPDQGRIQAEGEAYLAREFPLLDRVLQARVVE